MDITCNVSFLRFKQLVGWGRTPSVARENCSRLVKTGSWRYSSSMHVFIYSWPMRSSYIAVSYLFFLYLQVALALRVDGLICNAICFSCSNVFLPSYHFNMRFYYIPFRRPLSIILNCWRVKLINRSIILAVNNFSLFQWFILKMTINTI